MRERGRKTKIGPKAAPHKSGASKRIGAALPKGAALRGAARR